MLLIVCVISYDQNQYVCNLSFVRRINILLISMSLSTLRSLELEDDSDEEEVVTTLQSPADPILAQILGSLCTTVRRIGYPK